MWASVCCFCMGVCLFVLMYVGVSACLCMNTCGGHRKS